MDSLKRFRKFFWLWELSVLTKKQVRILLTLFLYEERKKQIYQANSLSIQKFLSLQFFKERNKSFFFLIVFKSSQEIVLIYTVCIALKLNSSLYETTAPRAAEHSVVLPTSALQ